MRIFALLLLLVWGQAWGATWYVRPGSSFGGTNAGTSYANAWQDWSSVVYASMAAGDTLIACGTFSYSGAGASFITTVATSGSAGNPFTVSGDCSASGDLARAVIINTGTRGNFLATNTQTYVNIDSFEISGFTNHGIWLCDTAACDQTVTRNINVSDMYIHDTEGNPGANPNAIYMGGRSITVTDSVLVDCGDDCIRGQGKNNTLSYLTISNPGLETATGDCIGYNGEVDGLVYANNSCVHPEDEKQCFLVSGPTDSGLVIVRDNTCTMPTTGTVGMGFYSEAAGQFLRNYTYGASRGMHFYTSYGVVYAYGNISLNNTYQCFGAGFGSLNTDVRLYNNSGYNCGTYGIAFDTNSTLSIARNNAISGATECYWEFNSSSTEEYNDLHNCTTVSTNGAGHSAGSAGTGTITTDPGWVVTAPTTAAGFRLSAGSANRRVGKDLNIGNVQDHGNRAFLHPPSIGAWEAGDEDAATARTAASARTARQ